MNRSAKGVLIVTTTLDGFKFAWLIADYLPNSPNILSTKLSIHQTFPLYGILYFVAFLAVQPFKSIFKIHSTFKATFSSSDY